MSGNKAILEEKDVKKSRRGVALNEQTTPVGSGQWEEARLARQLQEDTRAHGPPKRTVATPLSTYSTVAKKGTRMKGMNGVKVVESAERRIRLQQGLQTVRGGAAEGDGGDGGRGGIGSLEGGPVTFANVVEKGRQDGGGAATRAGRGGGGRDGKTGDSLEDLVPATDVARRNKKAKAADKRAARRAIKEPKWKQLYGCFKKPAAAVGAAPTTRKAHHAHKKQQATKEIVIEGGACSALAIIEAGSAPRVCWDVHGYTLRISVEQWTTVGRQGTADPTSSSSSNAPRLHDMKEFPDLLQPPPATTINKEEKPAQQPKIKLLKRGIDPPLGAGRVKETGKDRARPEVKKDEAGQGQMEAPMEEDDSKEEKPKKIKKDEQADKIKRLPGKRPRTSEKDAGLGFHKANKPCLAKRAKTLVVFGPEPEPLPEGHILVRRSGREKCPRIDAGRHAASVAKNIYAMLPEKEREGDEGVTEEQPVNGGGGQTRIKRNGASKKKLAIEDAARPAPSTPNGYSLVSSGVGTGHREGGAAHAEIVGKQDLDGEEQQEQAEDQNGASKKKSAIDDAARPAPSTPNGYSLLSSGVGTGHREGGAAHAEIVGKQDLYGEEQQEQAEDQSKSTLETAEGHGQGPGQGQRQQQELHTIATTMDAARRSGTREARSQASG